MKFLACLFALLLASCSMEHTIGEHAIGYNRSVEQSADSLMVLNILRARDEAPLHFTTIGSIRGGFSLGASLGYDGSTGLGNGIIPNINGSTNPGFDIGPLDRQEFARGLMRPFDPVLFRVLWDRNMPDQFLLYLLVSRFDEGPGGRRAINNPAYRNNLTPAEQAGCTAQGMNAEPPCDRFQAVVNQLTANGPILFNGYTRIVPIGPRLTQPQAAAPELLAALREPGISLRADGPGYRLMRAVDQMVICIPGPPDAQGRRVYTAAAVDREPPQVAGIPQDGDPCRADEVVEQPPGISGRPAVPALAWYLRSAEEVLQYLGSIQRREEQGVPYRISIRAAAEPSSTPRLFRLWRERPVQARFSTAYRGDNYWVAQHDYREDLTLHVLALTTQLLNLQKAAADIAASNTLRLSR
jgi:hypothetical protein